MLQVDASMGGTSAYADARPTPCPAVLYSGFYPCSAFCCRGQVAQLVEHVTENHGVAGSIPALATSLRTVNDMVIDIRAGTIDDVPLLLRFIRSMAAFEKLTVTATEESLRSSLFGDAPAAKTLLVFTGDEPIAYATYFFTFGTMTGRRGLWLDDLFIAPEYRSKGIGKAVMIHLAQIAIEHDCARFEWFVLDWNTRAIAFYERLGAQLLEAWRVCRLDEAGIRQLTAKD
jgi:GNAT superfamily N-acetyltransferase